MRRRSFLHAAGSSLLLAACGQAGIDDPSNPPDVPAPRLTARPSAAALTLAVGELRPTVGTTQLVTYLPASAAARSAVPLLVFQHGAGRNVDTFLNAFKPYCDAAGVMLLCPYSRGNSWDGILTPFGADVTGVNAALQWVFNRVPVDPARITLSGFSDGATHALALGRANGDLATRVVAFAPGGVIPVVQVGFPPILVTHGTLDEVFLHAYTRDTVVPLLRNAGHTVDFYSFTGGHGVPLESAEAEIDRLGGVIAP